MNDTELSRMLTAQPEGTFYITNNPTGHSYNQETILMKIGKGRWQEQVGNGMVKRVWDESDIIEEILMGQVAWGLF